MSGWVKVYRDLKNKPIWKQSTPEQKTILITLLMMADHNGNEWEWNGKKYTTSPGEMVTSLRSISENGGKGISIQNVRSALYRFAKLDFLTEESTKAGRKITILNWPIYQGTGSDANKESNSEVTKTQQRGNKEVTTNKNERMKEGKNVRKKRREKPADTTAFLDWYKQEHQKVMGSPVLISHGKDQRLVKEMLETFGMDDLKARASRFIKMDDEYFKNDKSIGILKFRVNKMGDKKGSATTAPQQSPLDELPSWAEEKEEVNNSNGEEGE